ncbi:MAG: ABC transporter substrate-binding protein [Nitrospirae bacterium YQR-1]
MAMKFNKFFTVFITLSLAVILTGCSNKESSVKTENDVIKIGVIAELTGEIPAVGASCKNASEMAVKAVNDSGGIDVGGRKMKIKLQIEDNAGRAEQAASAAQKLITQEKVVAIIGPNSSAGAIPASEITETSKIPMITPWSTNPKTTLDTRLGKPKRYAFRACYMDSFQGQVLAHFAQNNIKAKKAAILFDSSSEVLKGQAEVFKSTFEKNGGSISAYESYTQGDRNFSAQLTNIKNSAPDIVFLPSYYSDVPLQVQQAHRLGMTTPFLGSDAWASSDLLKLCGKDCEGFFFSSHYSASSKSPDTEKFVKAYETIYKNTPDDVAALTYDSLGILFQAVKTAGKAEPEAIRNAISQIRDYHGVTGNISFTQDSGDPVKGVVILEIKNGAFNWYADVNP